MAIIALKAWYVPEYEPFSVLSKRPHDLRLAKNSLLKSALRADFLDEGETVRDSEWFQRYLVGDVVEFYIEGSGSYTIANIDLVSHEIYFIKQDNFSHLEPTIFFCYQTQRGETSDLIRDVLQEVIQRINKRSRYPLTLEQSHRLGQEPIKLKSTLMSRLKRSLLLIADVSPVAQTDEDPPQLLLSPHVCVEVGYALQVKRPEQILLVQMQDNDGEAVFPFDLPVHNRVVAKDSKKLSEQLLEVMTHQLQILNILQTK